MKAFICKHCGKCCLSIPCIFAQVKYGITKTNKRQCPMLIKEGKLYRCLLIEQDSEAREVLLSGDCDNPKKSHLKKKFDAIPIVREYFPNVTENEALAILWDNTGYPDFWNIPQDGWTVSQCLRTQLSKLAKCHR